MGNFDLHVRLHAPPPSTIIKIPNEVISCGRMGLISPADSLRIGESMLSIAFQLFCGLMVAKYSNILFPLPPFPPESVPALCRLHLCSLWLQYVLIYGSRWKRAYKNTIRIQFVCSQCLNLNCHSDFIFLCLRAVRSKNINHSWWKEGLLFDNLCFHMRKRNWI